MHIPDGFLTNPVCAATTVLSAAGVGAAVIMRLRTSQTPAAMPAALLAAGIFAGQMLNFPVSGGTSGHLIGATLATALLGPASAILTMSSVLVVQCLVFGDGGLEALGANVLNLALVPVAVTQAMLWAANRAGIQRLAAVGIAAWFATMFAALVCSTELAASGIRPWLLVAPAMLRVHAMIGLGEAVVTIFVVAALHLKFRDSGTWKLPVAAGGVLAVVMASPWASSLPDGLEHVADRLQFSHVATTRYLAPLADYAAPGIAWPALSTILAAVAGTLLVFAVMATTARFTKAKTGARTLPGS